MDAGDINEELCLELGRFLMAANALEHEVFELVVGLAARPAARSSKRYASPHSVLCWKRSCASFVITCPTRLSSLSSRNLSRSSARASIGGTNMCMQHGG